MKKLFLFFILYFIQNSILFCISITPQFNIMANLGGLKTFTQTDVKHLDSYYMQGYSVYFDSIKGNIEINASIYAQLGFKTDIQDKITLGEFLEFGYYPYAINTKYNSKPFPAIYEYRNTDKMLFHSIILGIIEKIYFNNFSIGFGAGIIIPISGYGVSSNPEKIFYSGTEYQANYPLVMPTKNEFNHEDIKRMFKTPIAPYIKLTMEYEFFPFKFEKVEIGMIFGAYVSYNFGMKFNVSELNKYLPRKHSYLEDGTSFLNPLAANDIYYKYNFSSIDFGIMGGFSFRAYKD